MDPQYEPQCYCLEEFPPNKPGEHIHRKVRAKERCDLIPLDRFCPDPASYICQSASADREAQAYTDWTKAKEEAAKHPSVQAISKKPLHELDEPVRKLYLERLNKVLWENTYAKNDRMNRAMVYFNQAKEASLAFLRQRLSDSADPSHKRILSQMIERVRVAQPEFALGHERNEVADRNLYATSITHEVNQNNPLRRTTVVKKNLVTIGAMIEQLDYAPEAFYEGLLHEFGHFVDPGNFPLDDKSLSAPDDHPFYFVIECLKRSDAVGAKPNQLREAFADWFAMESWAKEKSASPAIVPVGMLAKEAPSSAPLIGSSPVSPQTAHNPSGGEIEGLNLKNSKLLAKIQEVTALHCALYRYWERPGNETRQSWSDVHPLSLDRVRNQLSAPSIKRSFGCPEKYIHEAKNLARTEIRDDLTVYCGQVLYGEQEPVSPFNRLRDKKPAPGNPLRKKR